MTMRSYHIFDQSSDKDKDLQYEIFAMVILNGPDRYRPKYKNCQGQV